jgi:hypothetical protein
VDTRNSQATLGVGRHYSNATSNGEEAMKDKYAYAAQVLTHFGMGVVKILEAAGVDAPADAVVELHKAYLGEIANESDFATAIANDNKETDNAS